MEKDLKSELRQIAIELYRRGPLEMNIWSRSGGDLSFLHLGQAGRDAWYEAVERLAQGGGGREITPQSLLATMCDDYPHNLALIALHNKLLDKNTPSENIAFLPSSEAVYKNEEQPWFVADFPPISELPSKEVLSFAPPVDVLILTATEVELKYTLARLTPPNDDSEILKTRWENETYYLGQFGVYTAVVTKCEMGLSGINASTLATEAALRGWQPRAAFMVGIAFGRDATKQHLGKVLIAKAVLPYDNQRRGERIITRGQSLTSDATLLNRFEHTYDWQFVLPDGSICQKELGLILSGEKLVDNLSFRDELFHHFPIAIGGEMEGAGFYAAAHRKRVPCLLLKAICDYGDGQKHKQHQPLAAAAACSLLHHVLSAKDSLPTNN